MKLLVTGAAGKVGPTFIRRVLSDPARSDTEEPVDYGKLADHLKRTRGLPSVEIRTAAHGTWFDNAKARFLLGWRPGYDLARLADAAWDYVRSPDDPRKIRHSG